MAQIRRPKRKSSWTLLLMIAAVVAILAIMMLWNPEAKPAPTQEPAPAAEVAEPAPETTINEQ